MKIKQIQIRNFCIISHINHGKSTLADRILEITKSINLTKINRVMDSMELEQERGITIKLNTAQMQYEHQGKNYSLNLIDTPGHIDFTYEVSRSLFACQGALLLIDASKGIQAQTITNLKLAQEANLKIIPIINKIDLKNIEINKIQETVAKLLKIKTTEISLISAKLNWGIEKLMSRIINEINPPHGLENAPLQALIFDAYYDQFQGVTGLIFVKNGFIKNKMKIKLINKNKEYQISNLQIKTPKLVSVEKLTTGQVGLFQGNIKKLNEIDVGDTIVNTNDTTSQPLTTKQKINTVVFANLFPFDQQQNHDLEKILTKIKLTDNALSFQKISTQAFGSGFHCGFLGLLHLEIIQARIDKEYDLEVIITAPNVNYQLKLVDQKKILINNIATIPDWNKVVKIAEPISNLQVLTPITCLGKVMKLIIDKRGKIEKENWIDQKQIMLIAKMPLKEIIIDFFDKLKSISNGFASFDYQPSHYQEDQLVKLDIVINKEIIPAFAQIIHQKQTYAIGKEMVAKLKTMIPKHNFQISLQAAINSKIIARENIKALQKNVTAKCYGGDISRKKKLWKKQKKGKLKMKMFGKVQIPGKVFINILKKEFK